MKKSTNQKLDIKIIFSDNNSEMFDRLEKIILKNSKLTSKKLPTKK
jgi:hypothetical protein